MGLIKKYFNNTRKPEGKLGEMMVTSMNGTSHAKRARRESNPNSLSLELFG